MDVAPVQGRIAGGRDVAQGRAPARIGRQRGGSEHRSALPQGEPGAGSGGLLAGTRMSQDVPRAVLGLVKRSVPLFFSMPWAPFCFSSERALFFCADVPRFCRSVHAVAPHLALDAVLTALWGCLSLARSATRGGCRLQRAIDVGELAGERRGGPGATDPGEQ